MAGSGADTAQKVADQAIGDVQLMKACRVGFPFGFVLNRLGRNLGAACVATSDVKFE